MAKKSNSSKPRSANRKSAAIKQAATKSAPTAVKNKWPIIVTATILVLFAGSVAYRKYQNYQEKNRFEQARQSVEKIYSAIAVNTPKPDQVERNNICYYGSRKLEHGPRSCSVGINVLHRNVSNKNANEIIDKASSAVSQNTQYFLPDTTNKQPVDFISTNPSDWEDFANAASYTENNTNMRCSIDYLRQAPNRSTFQKEKYEDQQKNLYITISCSDSAKQEHYQTQD